MSDHYFISYSTADALDFARKLADEMEGGYPYIKSWFDKRDIKPGDDWDDQIAEAIKTCKGLLFVLSRDSLMDGSVCKQEWSMALNYKKPVIPIRLHTDVELPFRLGSRQWIDFSENFDSGLGKLRKHIAWLDSPEGKLQEAKDRLADAKRALNRAHVTDHPRIRQQIAEIEADIKNREQALKK
jgi:hypothetical protein